jgi:lipoprotein-releasing system permease protein
MSRLPFELLLAFRYLRPKRTFVSVITLLSVIGVMLGVAVLIIVISVMTGFDRQLRDRLLGFNAHLRIMAQTPVADYDWLMEEIEALPKVRGVAPLVAGKVLVAHTVDGARRVDSPIVRGVDPEIEPRVSNLLNSVVQGTNDLRGYGVLVGEVFAYRMGIQVGDLIQIYSLRDLERMEQSRRDRGEIEEGYLGTDYEVRGIFDVGYYEFNERFLICSMANAQDLYDLNDAVQGFVVMLHDPEAARQVLAEIGPLLGRNFEVSTWEDDNAHILDALMVEKNVMFYLLFFIMIVASFGIMSVLITFVVQKTREIGVLKALGASSRQIMFIFLGQSFAVGVLGVITGFGLGLAGVYYRNDFLILLRRATSFELFPASIYNFTELPALVIPQDVAIICGGSLLISILAGLFPAWTAGRLKPVEALRHE